MNLFHALFPAVYAAEDWKGVVEDDVATFQGLESMFSNIISAVLSLGIAALFIMFLVGGFSFLFSGGDAKKLEQARGTLSNAIMGLVVIIAAYLILRIISVFTGVPDITIFRVPVE